MDSTAAYRQVLKVQLGDPSRQATLDHNCIRYNRRESQRRALTATGGLSMLSTTTSLRISMTWAPTPVSCVESTNYNTIYTNKPKLINREAGNGK